MRQPPVRSRRAPSRSRVAVRRTIALVVFACAAGAAVWLALAALGSVGRHSAAPATTAVAAAPKPLRIVFPEGFTSDQMAKRIAVVDGIAKRARHLTPKLSAARYRALVERSKVPVAYGASSPRTLEGLLFPATYDFDRKTTTKQLVQDQLAALKQNLTSVSFAYARSKHLTAYDVLTIASMIEEEARADSDRPLVAAVIYNRLHLHMPLGIDSTLRYGLHVPPTEQLHASQLANPTPYNTRLHTGLPPTPITNPGLSSIAAAARPAHVDYLYFILKPDKKHLYFTSSYSDFQNYANAHGYSGHGY